MPEISVYIRNGAAVTCSGDETAGLAGKGVALLQHKGAKGCIRHINTIRIGVVLCSGAGILQVVFSADFVHERPLNVGLTHGEKHSGHRFRAVAAHRLHACGEFNLSCFGMEPLF